MGDRGKKQKQWNGQDQKHWRWRCITARRAAGWVCELEKGEESTLAIARFVIFFVPVTNVFDIAMKRKSI